jgi:DNA-directed RNA polymerase subunit F
VDLLVHEAARIAELEQANAELRAQLTALARYFDGFNVADFEAAREAVREFTNTGGGA